MLESLFLQEIFSSKMLLRESGLNAIENTVRNLIEGKPVNTDDTKTSNIRSVYS